MKIEIETDELGNATKFKINGVDSKLGTTGYEIKHIAGEKPHIIIHSVVNELILNSKSIDLEKGENDL